MLTSIVFAAVSCSAKQRVHYEKFAGLYQITDRVCDGPDIDMPDCEQVRFIELVKGRLYGVSNKEVALVIWNGNAGEELLYQAMKLDTGKHDVTADGELIIVSDESVMEYFTIYDQKIVAYNLVVNSPKNIKKTHRYTLRQYLVIL